MAVKCNEKSLTDIMKKECSRNYKVHWYTFSQRLTEKHGGGVSNEFQWERCPKKFNGKIILKRQIVSSCGPLKVKQAGNGPSRRHI